MALTKIPASLLDTTGGLDLQGNITLGDNEQIQLGDSGDLQIYHNGNNSIIQDNGDGHVQVLSGTFTVGNATLSKTSAVFNSGGSQDFYHNNQKKFETSSTGATVTGNLAVTGDLDITGNVNSASVTDLDVTDKTITLGAGQTEALSGGSGIIIDGSGASLLWDETNTEWDFNKPVKIGDTLKLREDGTNDLIQSTGNVLYLKAPEFNFQDNSGNIQFYTTSSRNFIVQNNLGIGTSSDPTHKLHVQTDTASLTNLINIDNKDSSGNGGALAFTQYSSVKGRIKSYFGSGAWTLGFDTEDTTDALSIIDNGNVGIGTTNPASILTVDSGTADDAYSATGFNSESQIKIDVASTQNNYAGIQFTHSGNTEGFIGLVRPSAAIADSDFVIQGYCSNDSAYKEYLRISDEGDLGLGTTAPTHSANYRTLDIRGADGGQILAGRGSHMDFFMYTDSTSAKIGALNDIHFQAGSTGGQEPKLIIKSDGKVGIGTGTGTVSGNLHVEGGSAHNNVYITSTANSGTGYDATLHLLGSASNSESKINLGSNNNPDAVSIKSYQNILTLRTNDEDRAYINASGQFLMNSNDGGSGKVTAANTWSGAKFIVRETNGFIDMQSSGDGQTVGYRLGYRENTSLAGYIKYGTGFAQMSIENNYTGSNSQNEYSTIYFKNKNGSGTLYSRMRIGGANGYISTNPVGNAAQTSHQFEVQGGTAGTIFLSNNLVGYPVGQYPVVGTSGNDLHFQAGNTYTGYISYNGGFTDVSDEREKENITTIKNATAKLKQLRGVTHTWKDNRDDGAIHLGLIAQEVQAVVPEVVTEGPLKPDETESTLGVSYQKLVPLLIETIKELEARITELEG